MTAFVAPKVLGLQLEGQVKNLRSAVRKIGKLLRRDSHEEDSIPVIRCAESNPRNAGPNAGCRSADLLSS